MVAQWSRRYKWPCRVPTSNPPSSISCQQRGPHAELSSNSNKSASALDWDWVVSPLMLSMGTDHYKEIERKATPFRGFNVFCRHNKLTIYRERKRSQSLVSKWHPDHNYSRVYGRTVKKNIVKPLSHTLLILRHQCMYVYLVFLCHPLVNTCLPKMMWLSHVNFITNDNWICPNQDPTTTPHRGQRTFSYLMKL